MNSFLDEQELQRMNFKSIGKQVLISRKASIYGADKMTIGDHVRIDDFCILSGTVNLKSYIHISAFAALYGGSAGIFIDDFCSISSRVTIYAVTDDYSGEGMANPMVPEKFRKILNAAVNIEKHVLIGSSCVVLPGVVLKEGSSFGAMSLINKSTEEWSVNFGIPCRKSKDRKRDIQSLELQFLEEERKD